MNEETPNKLSKAVHRRNRSVRGVMSPVNVRGSLSGESVVKSSVHEVKARRGEMRRDEMSPRRGVI